MLGDRRLNYLKVFLSYQRVVSIKALGVLFFASLFFSLLCIFNDGLNKRGAIERINLSLTYSVVYFLELLVKPVIVVFRRRAFLEVVSSIWGCIITLSLTVALVRLVFYLLFNFEHCVNSI